MAKRKFQWKTLKSSKLVVINLFNSRLNPLLLWFASVVRSMLREVAIRSILKSGLVTIGLLFICPLANSQTVNPTRFLEKKSVVHPDYWVVKSQSKRFDQKRSFFRELGASYYIVETIDTAYVESVLGPANDLWKFPSVKYASGLSFPCSFVVSMRSAEATAELLSSLDANVNNHPGTEITVAINNNADFERIKSDPRVIFIKKSIAAHEEASNSFQDLTVNRINLAHVAFPAVTGEGFTVGLKEKSVDTTDLDLKNRAELTELADDEISLHATMIATIIAGAGNSQPSSKGVATRGQIVSTSFDNLLPDDNNVLNNYGVTVQNHSYGTTIENFYGPEAVAFDRTVTENPTRVHVFSSGNSGQNTSPEGIYSSVSQFANLTGNMKMAKNILVVGGHYNDLTIDPRNSRGPAYDGRIKPDVIAFGPEGTSDAAGFVSGTCVLLQHRYKQIFGVVPTVDVVKAALIVTADDVGNSGPDFTSGFGAMNAHKALALIDKQFLTAAFLQPGESKKISITVPTGVAKLRVAVSWIDPPAVAGSAKALVNDLDLKVTSISNGSQWLPWTLSSYPHIDSLTRSAKRAGDHLNNVEFVSVENPAAGTYEFEVGASNLQTSSQAFALAYWIDYSNSFQWTCPTLADPVQSNSETFFRWDSSYDGVGVIEVWINSELVVTKDVELSKGFESISIPNISGMADAIMKVNGESISMVTFVISPPVKLRVELNCDAGSLVSWSKVSGANGYKVFRMGEMYMQPIATTSDTSFAINKDTSTIYSIAPMVNDAPGVRSAAYDINNQGVGCYYTNFLAESTETGEGRLILNLSTEFNIDEIVWQKFSSNDFVDIATTAFDKKLHYVFIDDSMVPGVTLYRAVIKTKTGDAIPTEVSTVYYADDRTYALFPNPVERQSELNILAHAQDLRIRFYSRTGQLVKVQAVPFDLFRISVSDLLPGLYLYSIQRGSSIVSSGRLLVK